MVQVKKKNLYHVWRFTESAVRYLRTFVSWVYRLDSIGTSWIGRAGSVLRGVSGGARPTTAALLRVFVLPHTDLLGWRENMTVGVKHVILNSRTNHVSCWLNIGKMKHKHENWISPTKSCGRGWNLCTFWMVTLFSCYILSLYRTEHNYSAFVTQIHLQWRLRSNSFNLWHILYLQLTSRVVTRFTFTHSWLSNFQEGMLYWSNIRRCSCGYYTDQYYYYCCCSCYYYYCCCCFTWPVLLCFQASPVEGSIRSRASPSESPSELH